MNYDKTTSTTAHLHHAWAALAAITTFPQWTASITSIEPLDGPALRVSHRFRVRQPGFPPVVWRVSEVRDGESFTWVSRSPGLHTEAFHRLSRNSDGTTQISIGIRQSGILSGLMAVLTAARTRHYLDLEAAGLQAAAEAHAAATSDRRVA